MDEVTVSALLSDLKSDLSRAGIPSSEVEAEMILGHVLGLKRSEIYRQPGRRVTDAEERAIADLVNRRSARVPLQYLLGECEFMSLPFRVREDVFIPRPETEILVETVMRWVQAGHNPARAILDIGTGSGVIAVSLARYLAPDIVVATDISLNALETARANAILNRVESVTYFAVCERLSALRKAPGMEFDIVVCNPPYVETGEIPGLQPEVRDYEPLAALDGGPDGLRFIEGIMPEIPSVLKEGGLAAFEIGNTQGPRVKTLFEQAGLTEVGVVRDLAGLDRIVLGRRY
jgi:release factor glutamine methyltransferase